MSGNQRFLLDTNAIVSLLAGNHNLATLLEAADYVGISIVSYLEFLAFDGLSESDHTCFASFCARIEIVPLSQAEHEIIEQSLTLRKDYRLKLSDAIIGATALSRHALLVTNDSHFSTVKPLTVLSC